MRLLPVLLAVLLASMPALQAYGETMAGTHCRTHGHPSGAAADEGQAPHAQHHAPASSAHAHDAAVSADAGSGGAHCQCGCLCEAACAGGAALAAWVDVPAEAPAHEPWQAASDIRRPVSVHDFLLRPPRLS